MKADETMLRNMENESEKHRSAATHTLEAIQRRLSSGALSSDTWQYIRENGADLGQEVAQTIRRHPVPTALVGFGIGWLLYASLRKDGPMSEAKAYATRARRARAGASQQVEKVYRTAREGVAAVGTRTREGVDSMGGQIRTQAMRVRSNVSDTFDEQPMLLGALGLLLGGVIGAVLPTTRRENELFGEARDELVEKAEALGREQVDRVTQAAERTWDTAKEEVQGLSGDRPSKNGNGGASMSPTERSTAEAAGDDMTSGVNRGPAGPV